MEPQQHSLWKSLLFITVGVMLIVTLAFGTLEISCRQRYSNLDIYPESELIDAQTSSLFPFGSGFTYAQYYSPEEARVVERWMNETYNTNVREILSRDTVTQQLPPRYWRVESDDTGGSITHVTFICP